jgi:hypothetical protein
VKLRRALGISLVRFEPAWRSCKGKNLRYPSGSFAPRGIPVAIVEEFSQNDDRQIAKLIHHGSHRPRSKLKAAIKQPPPTNPDAMRNRLAMT